MKFVFSGRAQSAARGSEALRATTGKMVYLITPRPPQKNCREKVSSQGNVNEMRNCVGRFRDYSQHKILRKNLLFLFQFIKTSSLCSEPRSSRTCKIRRVLCRCTSKTHLRYEDTSKIRNLFGASII